MYRHARSVLEEFLTQHPLTYQCHSRSLSNEPSPERGAKCIQVKAHKSNTPRPILIKKTQIRKEIKQKRRSLYDKNAQDVTREQVIFLYTLLCNRLVNPFLELIVPGIKSEDQLSNLTDFRKGHWPLIPHSKAGSTYYSRCLEEPTPFKLKKPLGVEDCLIKDPRLILKDKIKRKVDFALVKINKHKYLTDLKTIIHKAKSEEEPGSSYSPWYKIFLKRPVDSMVKSLTPNIYGSVLERLSDFRGHDEAFSLGHSHLRVESMKPPFITETFSSTSGIKRNLNEIQIKDGNIPTYYEISAVAKDDTQALHEPKQKELTNLETISIPDKHNIDNVKSDLIIESQSTSDILPKVYEESKVLINNAEKQTTKENSTNMKKLSSEKNKVSAKTKSNKLSPKVGNKNIKHRVKETSKSIKSTEQKVPQRDHIEKIDVNTKKVSLQNRTEPEKNIKNEEERTSAHSFLEQRIQNSIESMAVKSTIHYGKIINKNTIFSNSTTPNKVGSKLEYNVQTSKPPENKTRNNNKIDTDTSETVGAGIKLKKTAVNETISNKQSRLVEESNSKNTLMKGSNKPKFVVKRKSKSFQFEKVSEKKKTLRNSSFGDPSSAKLVTFKASEEEQYFVTKEKKFTGAPSDLINLKDVLDSEERTFKIKNAIPAKNEHIGVRQTKSSKGGNDIQKHDQQRKESQSTTDNLKSYEFVRIQGLTEIDTAPRFDFSNQNVKTSSKVHEDLSKKYQNQSKPPLATINESKIKQIQQQTIFSHNNKYQSTNQLKNKENVIRDKNKQQKKQVKESNMNNQTQLNMKSKGTTLVEKRDSVVIANNSDLSPKIVGISKNSPVESFKVITANNVVVSQTIRSSNKVTQPEAKDASEKMRQSGLRTVKTQDGVNTLNKIESSNKGETSIRNLNESQIGSSSEIFRKSKSVEDITNGLSGTKGFVGKYDLNVSKNPKFDKQAQSETQLKISGTKTLTSNKNTKSQEKIGPKTNEPNQERVKQNTEIKSNTVQKSRSFDAIFKSEMLDSNFELNKVFKRTSTNSEKKAEEPKLSNSKIDVKENLKVPRPQFDSKKEGIKLIKDKQKDTFYEISKKREEKFSFLKNESKTKVDSKVEIINKKIPSENLKPTVKKSFSENKLSTVHNKIEGDKLMSQKSSATQKTDNIEHLIVASPGGKSTSRVWNSNSAVDQTSKESIPVIDKNANSGIAKLSGNLYKNTEKETNLNAPSSGFKAEKLGNNQLKTAPNLQHLGLQQTTQLYQNTSSDNKRSLNATIQNTPSKTPVKQVSVNNILASASKSTENVRKDNVEVFIRNEKPNNSNDQVIKNSLDIDSNTVMKREESVRKSDVGEPKKSLTDDGAMGKTIQHAINVKAIKYTPPQSYLTSNVEKMSGKVKQSKFEAQDTNFTTREDKNKVAELKFHQTTLETKNSFQNQSEKSKGNEMAKADDQSGKGEKSKLDNLGEGNKNNAGFKFQPTDSKADNSLHKTVKHTNGNELTETSKVNELIGKVGPSKLEELKNESTQVEDKAAGFQYTNIKTGKAFQKASDNSTVGQLRIKSKGDELNFKGEQGEWKVEKYDHTKSEGKDKITELKVEATNVKTGNVLQKAWENSKGNEFTKKSIVNERGATSGQSKKGVEHNSDNNAQREGKNNLAGVKLHPPSNIIMGNPARENSKEKQFTKISQRNEVTVNSLQSKWVIQKSDHIQREDKNKVNELKLQPTNIRLGNLVFPTASDNSKGNDLIQNSKAVEVIKKNKLDSKLNIQNNNHIQRVDINKIAGLKLQQKNVNAGNVAQISSGNLVDDKFSNKYIANELTKKSEENKLIGQQNDSSQGGEKSMFPQLKTQPTSINRGNILQKDSKTLGNKSTKNSKLGELNGRDEQKMGTQNNDLPQSEKINQVEKSRSESVGKSRQERKIEVPKYNYGVIRKSKNKPFELKTKPSNLATKNNSEDSNTNSKGEILSSVKIVKTKIEVQTKNADIGDINTNSVVRSPPAKLSLANPPHQITTTGGSSQSSAEKLPSQGISKGVNNYEIPHNMYDYSHKKENKDKAELEVQSMKSKQQNLSHQSANKFQMTNASIKKSASANPQQKQGTALSGRSKTTLEETVPNILQADSVQNMSKADLKSILYGLNFNENSSVNKHRPIAKISAPSLPNNKAKANPNLESTINVKVQSNRASKDHNKNQQITNRSVSQTNINLKEK